MLCMVQDLCLRIMSSADSVNDLLGSRIISLGSWLDQDTFVIVLQIAGSFSATGSNRQRLVPLMCVVDFLFQL